MEKASDFYTILYFATGIMLLFALLIVFLVIIYQNYFSKLKQKQLISDLEKQALNQRLLLTQMNPHFIFNSIDNIQSLIYNNQPSDAINYLNKFSKLTRQILENSNEDYITLTEEIEMIENYMVIQQLLYDNKFEFKIDVESQINSENILLPPMLTQPFIENAIKHGLSSKNDGKVEICFYMHESKLLFEVCDNGVGFVDSKKPDSHKSLAMAITKERLVHYSKNMDFVLQTHNIEDEDKNIVGAKVVFEIPYIYEK